MNRFYKLLRKLLGIFIVFISCLNFSLNSASAMDYKGEKIVYAISPIGRAEYNDLGISEINGRKVHVVTLKTQMMGFADTEKIYSDPQTYLPIKVERNVTLWFKKEYLVEHYDQDKFLLTIEKFKAKKKIKEYVFQKDSPIYNAILLPFYLRTVSNLDIGWEIKTNVPEEFTLKLASFEQIRVSAGKFMTYHFTSSPSKFEIWISKDTLCVPIKIKGLGGFSYTMVMKKHYLPQTKNQEDK
jgi:hypothetical protein